MKNSPYVIAVAGGTGSGKTTIVQKLLEMFDSTDCIDIKHDNYYRDQSDKSIEQRKQTNYDHPLSLETELLVEHLQKLKSGEPVEMPLYDYVEHTRSSQTIALSPTKVIIVEGILIFESEKLRREFDLKIFVDTDADIRFIRRLQRDIAERGRDMQSVIDQYITTVKPMHEEFVEPSKRFADLIIPEGLNTAALGVVLARMKELTQLQKDFQNTDH